MNQKDATLVTGFLIREFEQFAIYLENCDMDPLEASAVIGALASEFNCSVDDVCACYDAGHEMMEPKTKSRDSYTHRDSFEIEGERNMAV